MKDWKVYQTSRRGNRGEWERTDALVPKTLDLNAAMIAFPHSQLFAQPCEGGTLLSAYVSRDARRLRFFSELAFCASLLLAGAAMGTLM